MSRNSSRVAIAISALIAGILLWPISSLGGPEWKIRVVDRSGTPVRSVVIRESCRDYSAELNGQREDLRPDDQGYATFSKRIIRVPLVKRLFVVARSAGNGVHASFGPHCFAFAFRGGVESDSIDWEGSASQLSSTIVIDRDAVLENGSSVR